MKKKSHQKNGSTSISRPHSGDASAGNEYQRDHPSDQYSTAKIKTSQNHPLSRYNPPYHSGEIRWLELHPSDTRSGKFCENSMGLENQSETAEENMDKEASSPNI
jgi:hypothetical protein